MDTIPIGTAVRRRIDAKLAARGWTHTDLGAAMARPIKEAAVSRRLGRIEAAPDRCLGSIAEFADALGIAPAALYPERFAAPGKGRRKTTAG